MEQSTRDGVLGSPRGGFVVLMNSLSPGVLLCKNLDSMQGSLGGWVWTAGVDGLVVGQGSWEGS